MAPKTKRNPRSCTPDPHAFRGVHTFMVELAREMGLMVGTGNVFGCYRGQLISFSYKPYQFVAALSDKAGASVGEMQKLLGDHGITISLKISVNDGVLVLAPSHAFFRRSSVQQFFKAWKLIVEFLEARQGSQSDRCASCGGVAGSAGFNQQGELVPYCSSCVESLSGGLSESVKIGRFGISPDEFAALAPNYRRAMRLFGVGLVVVAAPSFLALRYGFNYIDPRIIDRSVLVRWLGLIGAIGSILYMRICMKRPRAKLGGHMSDLSVGKRAWLMLSMMLFPFLAVYPAIVVLNCRLDQSEPNGSFRAKIVGSPKVQSGLLIVNLVWAANSPRQIVFERNWDHGTPYANDQTVSLLMKKGALGLPWIVGIQP